MSTESLMPFYHLILCYSLLLLPLIFPSIRVFSSELALHIRAQSIEASASVLVFPTNIQGWFSLGLTALISLQSKGLSRVFSSTTVQKYQFFSIQSSSQELITICRRVVCPGELWAGAPKKEQVRFHMSSPSLDEISWYFQTSLLYMMWMAKGE